MSPVGPTLTSTHNPHIKLARLLGTRKGRYRERAFVVESTRLFEDAISVGFVPERVFFDASRLSETLTRLIYRLADGRSVVHEASLEVIDAIADTETPQGLAAIFRFPDLAIDIDQSPALFVVADGIKDPGNLGTLMRSAVAAGAHALYVSAATVDPYSPKVIRAGMGAHFRLPIRQMNWDSPDPLFLACAQRLGAEAGDHRTYDAFDWNEPTALVLGSEASGLSSQAQRYLTDCLSIPLLHSVESLNAAVAGAVILFEAARQRRTQ